MGLYWTEVVGLTYVVSRDGKQHVVGGAVDGERAACVCAGPAGGAVMSTRAKRLNGSPLNERDDSRTAPPPQSRHKQPPPADATLCAYVLV